MSGGSKQHVRVSGNVYFGLRQQLTGRAREVFNSDLAVKTPVLPPYRYPDVSAVCGEAQFENVEGTDVLINPTLIVEVLSPATGRRDRNEKRVAYQSLPTVIEYLMLAQDVPHLTHFLRQETQWVRADYANLDATIVLSSIGCVLTLSDVYLGVEF
jgi:Uma2 family endonuclease